MKLKKSCTVVAAIVAAVLLVPFVPSPEQTPGGELLRRIAHRPVLCTEASAEFGCARRAYLDAFAAGDALFLLDAGAIC